MPDTRSQMPDARCPEKPEIFDFIVFRGSAIPGTGNRDLMPKNKHPVPFTHKYFFKTFAEMKISIIFAHPN
jgi:hypothetical protein